MEKGNVLVLLVKEDWFRVGVELSFALDQETPGKCFLCFQRGFCLFLSGLSYHLTAVCGGGQESI